jgi:hypothetical protein
LYTAAKWKNSVADMAAVVVSRWANVLPSDVI